MGLNKISQVKKKYGKKGTQSWILYFYFGKSRIWFWIKKGILVKQTYNGKLSPQDTAYKS